MDSHTLYGNTLGHYSLVREAGRGGMSTVYEAVDTRLGRTVALKLLAVPPYLMPAERDALVARLRREARAVGSLSHPNVVTIFDVGEHDGLHFLVMEYLDGVTLRARLDTGPLSAHEAADILDQVAAGLDAVHAQGVLHRDIKPSNVMLLPGGGVKLMDFGVARQADDTTMTQAGTMVGSPSYMSPEQIEGNNATAASDIWSLGVLLYEMLAGKPPFTAATIASVLYQVAHQPPTPLPGVSAPVQKVLQNALEKDPSKRYGTASALAAAFRAAAISAPPAATAATAARQPQPRQPQRTGAGAKGGAVAAAAAAPVSPPSPAPPRQRLARRPLPLLAAGALLIPALVGASYLLRSRGAERPVPARTTAVPPAGTAPAAARPATAQSPVVPDRPVAKPENAAPRQTQVAAERNNSPTVTIKEETPRPNRIETTVPEEPRQSSAQEPEQAAAAPKREHRAAAVTAVVEPEPRQEAPRRRKRRREVSEPAASSPAPPAERVTEQSPGAVPPLPPPAAAREPATTDAETASPAKEDPAAPALVGTWQGFHTGNPATLTITRHRGDDFSGTMTVRTNEGRIRVAVSGSVTRGGSGLILRERRVLTEQRRNSWDLGTNAGRLSGQGRMTGSGTDRGGRTYTWFFAR